MKTSRSRVFSVRNHANKLTNMYRVVVFMCLYLQICNTQSDLFEGAPCKKGNTVGVCTNIRECKSAQNDLRNHKRPQICMFSGDEPIVCCFDSDVTMKEEVITKPQWMTSPTPTPPEPTTTPPPPPTTTPAPPETTTTSTTMALEGSDSKFLGQPEQQEPKISSETACPPIQEDRTAPKTGQKAWDKCIEYQERLILPCDATNGMRYNYCKSDLNTWILNGEDAFEGEFPHMALVGYGSDPAELSFLCGGSLISENFVLTAGHCISSRELGPISHVLLGILKRSVYEQSNLYKVRTVIKHPNYKPPKKYNDIALLQLDKPATLSDLIIPACLEVADDGAEEVATATGWGTTQFRGASADVLQKVDLTRFREEECKMRYMASRNMANGFDSKSQICYGDRTMAKDTCQGDSGGPLQIRHKKVYCMYTVIGVTSFGRACGIPGEPALYTRIAHYLPWIEAIVWPDA